MVFDLVAGICGIIAFIILCAQGALLLRKERHVLFTRDAARSLALVKKACEDKHLTYTELKGTVAGVEVSGRAYKVRSVHRQCERENWLSQLGATKFEIR
jgi:hypothetical protein